MLGTVDQFIGIDRLNPPPRAAGTHTSLAGWLRRAKAAFLIRMPNDCSHYKVTLSGILAELPSQASSPTYVNVG